MTTSLVDKDQLRRTIEQRLLQKADKSMLCFTLYNLPYYQASWFHRNLCKKLQAFANGKIKRLMVNTPPQHGKSELVSRALPPFILGRNPNANVISASYNSELANDMSRAVQRIMGGPRYSQVFPNTKIPSIGSKIEGAKRTENHVDIIGCRGVYRAAGVGKGITGKSADFLIIDDVIKDSLEADSPTYRQRVWDWYLSTFLTRARSSKDVGILITMTRWHEDDLAGRLLKLAKDDPKADQWEVLTLPAIQDRPPDDWDPRELGEALWPERHPVESFHRFQAGSARVWNALFQQRPSALKGNIIKRDWIKFYDVLPSDLHDWQHAWDLNFKGKDQKKNQNKASYAVGQVWARKGPDCYLVDQYRDRPNFPQAVQAVKTLAAKHPHALRKLIEDAANGPAMVSTLSSELAGIIPVPTKGQSKVERLNAVSPMFEAGNVWFPRWAEGVVEELLTFPNGVNDDQVDALSMSLNYYRENVFDNIKLDLGFGLRPEGWRL